MKIPRNLKPGTKLWYSKTEYATAAVDLVDSLLYDEQAWRDDTWIWAKDDKGNYLAYNMDGHEVDGETPPIIRIERIASAKPKTVAQRQLAAAKDHLRRKMEGDEKRAKADNDAAVAIPRSIVRLIRAWEIQRKDGVTQLTKSAEIVRAIARRLEGGGR